MENEYKDLIDEIRDAYFMIQNEKFVLISKHLAEFFGYTKEELVGMYFSDLIAPEDRNMIREFYKNRLSGQPVPQRYEAMGLTRDGIIKPVEGSAWLINSTYQGQPAIAGIVIGLTERGKTQGKLIESELKYRTLVESIPQKAFFKDRNSAYVYCNKNYATDLGIEPAEISGKTDYDFYPRNLANKYRSNDKRIVETGQGENIEEKYIKDNEERMVQTVKIPVKDTNDNVIGILGVFEDITEKKRSVEALKESEERLRLIFKSTPDGIVITDKNAIITQANDQVLKLYGVFHEGELIGKSALELIAPRHRKTAMDYLQRCMDDGLIMQNEYSITRTDSSIITVETIAGRLRDGSGNPVGLIAVVRDITQEKHIRENEQSYIIEAIKSAEGGKQWIARTLHDDTIQELLIASHRLQDVIEENYGHLPKRAKSHLEETRLLTERLITDIRSFITDIRPDVLDNMGLVPALRWLAGSLRDEHGIDAKVVILGDQRRLMPQSELNLFRIAQEALSNVRRHANAIAATITLEFGKEKLALSISDNGMGFEVPEIISQFARQQKLGIIGIIERAHLLGGDYKIESSLGRGTIVRVEIDITNQSNVPEGSSELFPSLAAVANSDVEKKAATKGKKNARRKRKTL